MCPETVATQESCTTNPDSCAATPGATCTKKEACVDPTECPCKGSGDCQCKTSGDCPCKGTSKYSETSNAVEASHIFVTKSSGVIAIHSQNTLVPECPLGQNKLWEGYSLMKLETNEQSTNFDLGSSGSCVKTFMPSVSATCDIEGQCTTGQRNDRSFWLLANGTVGTEAVTQELAKNLVSRCVACDVPSAVVAVHSQSTEVPKCPDGWDDLWFGYSYLVSGAYKILNLSM